MNENLKNLSTKELEELKVYHEEQAGILDSRQNAIKIGLLNSLFGATGNPGFRFFDRELARSITMSGQSTIKWSERVVNRYLNETFRTKDVDYTIYTDTDSVILNLKPLYEKIKEKNPDTAHNDLVNTVDSFCVHIQTVLQRGYDELYKRMNGLENRLEMKRESIGAGVFYQKKRYIMAVYDDEGVRYTEPKSKIKGLEAVRSSTPEWSRKKMKQVFMDIFTKTPDEMVTEIEKIREEFHALPYVDIAIPSGVTEIDKFISGNSYIKGTPYHVKASIHHNLLLKEKDVGDKYEAIKNGDKIKMLKLKTPNPIGNDMIGFIDYLPAEFELENYLDKDGQFDKIFLKPVKSIFDVIGYPVERKNSADDFF